MDAISETRLDLVHPELKRRVHQLADMLSFPIRVTRGLASYAEQDVLYAQGRTAPGNIVTNAKGGYSMHCFGLAVDLVPMTEGLPDWDANDSRWQEMLAKGLTCGLEEGAHWTHVKPDFPHFYPQELPAGPSDAMREIFATQGLKAVWDSLFPLTGEQKA